jgi:hypothetical protein
MYARDISDVVKKPLGVAEAANGFVCRRFIEENLSAFERVAPTSEMRNFVLRAAARYRVQVPRAVLLDRTLCDEWITNFRSPAVSEVTEIMNEFSFTHSSFDRIARRVGITLKNDDWTQTPAFLTLMIEEYRAKSMLSRGIDAYSVATALHLPDSVVADIERDIEPFTDDAAL